MSSLRRAVIVITLFVWCGYADQTNAEAPWTRSGNCMECHANVGPGLLTVFNEDGIADPAQMIEK